MVEELKAKLAAATEEMQKATKAVEEEVEAVEKSKDALDGEEKSTRKSSDAKKSNTQSARQMAGGIALASVAVVALGEGLQNMADALQATDPAMAENLRTTGEWTTRIGSAVGTVAMGFAAGGPHGAAVAGLGVAVSEVMGMIARESEEAAAKKVAAFEAASKAAQAAEAEGLQATRNSIAQQVAEYGKLTAAVERTITQLKRKQSIEDEIANAQLALDMAKVDAKEKAGELTAEEAIAERSGLRKGARQEANKRENFATESEIFYAENTELPGARNKSADLAKDAKDAKREADVAKRVQEQLDRSPGLKNSLLGATNDSEKRSAMEDIRNSTGVGADERMYGIDVNKIIEQVAGAGADGFETEARKLKEEADKAAAGVSALREKIRDLQAELEKDKRVQSIDEERFNVVDSSDQGAAERKTAEAKARAEQRAAEAARKAAEAGAKAELATAQDASKVTGGNISSEAAAAGKQSGSEAGADILKTITKAFADGAISAAERGGVDSAVAALNASAAAKDNAVLQSLQAMLNQFQQQEKKIAALKSRIDKGGV